MTTSDQSPTARRCAQCGAELPEHVPASRCPKCLLKSGLETQLACPEGTSPGVADRDDIVVVHGPEMRRRGLPQPGEQFGHYQIVRRLGEGGMGAVFDAEDLDNGRHVALKILSHTLDSPEARERFFREGRLAASINHPNSVYVFGTEEIGGTPVIAMERVPGGTLCDRVRDAGPMPVGEAVDAILQIIAGLEAAQRIGVLHRDVKPSNCFVDTDGTVKIGDFGLSISTAVRTEPALTATGMFLGTPAFCSPEQLRGDELGARSDMYSVGATLFYLLTGHTPFEAKNPVQLLATVLEQPPPSPRNRRPDLPHGLAQVVLRCLHKLPGDRFRTYDELRQALAAYSSAAPTPATLGLRFLAGALDLLLLNLVFLAVAVPLLGSPIELLTLIYQRSPRALATLLATGLVSILYYALLDGLRGATLGKALCGLRVVGPDRSVPGLWRGLGRAASYVLLPPLPFWLVYGGDPTAHLDASSPVRFLMSSSFYLVLALLFCTARRRNGFAAVHDLATGTRVISRLAVLARPTLATMETTTPSATSGSSIGPYHVLETLANTPDTKWLLAYDLQLLRKVWVRVVPPCTPPLAPPLRNLGRVGRLRWLAGRRTPEDAWDAFEAVAGSPLVRLLEQPQPWDRVRFWLHDLATEISAAEKDGTSPAVLALDRVWITGDGRAKLLDFPAPESVLHGDGAKPPTSQGSAAPGHGRTSVHAFLKEVAEAALGGRSPAGVELGQPTSVLPLPLHARAFLDQIGSAANGDAIVAMLKPLLSKAGAVSRLRRFGVVTACAALPAVAALGMIFASTLFDRMQQNQPGVFELTSLLGQRGAMRLPWMKSGAGPDDRLFAIYIAHRFRPTITDSNTWANPYVLSVIKPEDRRFAEQSVKDYPQPTEEEIRQAETALKPYAASAQSMGFFREPWFPLAVIGVSLILYVGIPALLCALLFRGGLALRALGIAVVRPDSRPASRLRVFWRGLVAWSPILLAPVFLGSLRIVVGTFWAAALLGLLVIGLTAVSVALPQRSLQDRLAGTWLVPR